MFAPVLIWMRSCENAHLVLVTIEETHPGKHNLQAPSVDEPGQRVSVDTTGPHPRSSESNQYNIILTLVDHVSKWAKAIPLRNHTTPMVATALVIQVFSLFGHHSNCCLIT